MKRALSIAFTILAIASAASAVETDDRYNEVTIRPSDIPPDAPRFEAYPASVYEGPNALPNLSSDSETRMYRTRIKEWSKVKPNFAGHYILATWGCGTECVQMTIIDAKTGKVFHPSGVTSNAANNVHDALIDGKPNWPNEGSIKFQANSELLVLIGMPEEDTKRRGISYYIWHHNRLSLVRFVPKAWYR
jgi:hypothetical protein